MDRNGLWWPEDKGQGAVGADSKAGDWEIRPGGENSTAGLRCKEEKQTDQIYRSIFQLKELKERQRQQNKQKAIKLGLDPEWEISIKIINHQHCKFAELSLANILPRSECTQSTRDALTHGHTTTGGNSMREAGTFSTPSCWRNLGRRKWTSGQEEPSVSYCQVSSFLF